MSTCNGGSSSSALSSSSGGTTTSTTAAAGTGTTTTTTTNIYANSVTAVVDKIKIPNQHYLMTDSNNSIIKSSCNEINAEAQISRNSLSNGNAKILNGGNGGAGCGGGISNKKSDYVDFNQFIAQHNFLGHNNNKTNNNSSNNNNNNYNNNANASSATTIQQQQQQHQQQINNGCFSSEFTPNSGDSIANNNKKNSADLIYQHMMASNNYNHDYSTGNSLFGYNVAVPIGTAQVIPTMPLNGGSFPYENGSYDPYNNGFDYNYSSFGLNGDSGGAVGASNVGSSSSNNGFNSTVYLANPFSAGFDLSTEVGSSSQLQATASEFVPRFKNLKINPETTQELNDRTANLDQKSFKKERNGYSEMTNVKSNGNEKVLKPEHESRNEEQQTSSTDKNSKPHNGHQSNNKNEISGAESRNENNKDLPVASETFARGSNYNRNRKAYGRDGQKGNASGGFNGNASPSSTPLHRRASAARAAECDNRRFQQQNHYNTNGGGGGGGASTVSSNGGTDNTRNESTERPRNTANGGANLPPRQDQRYNNYERNNKYDRYERPIDRNERNNRGHRDRGDRDRERDYHYQRDNYRSNKRRDDWNRNRDRANGFRLEEKYSSDNGKDSPLPSPEKKPSPRKSKNNSEETEKLSQREKLIRDIETRRLECLVCVEPIKSHHAVWSCSNCYHILHLQCITKWASSSKSEDGWRCPACQNINKDIPRDYYCFCGKVKNPQFNRQDTAHSCGEVCGHVEGCTHACTLLCHPGPCPPCQANVTRNCGCGKTSKTMQCCLKEMITCDATCDKLLNCESHTCAAKCHEGKCEPCAEKVEQVCHCSKQDRQVTCTRETHDKKTYSCGKPCGKDLACGNHKCKDCCHAGECRPCKLSPDVVTSCPCGKMQLLPEQRASCLDPIPVCEDVCGKTLRCGKSTNPHHCTAKCHTGNCPPCNKQTAVKCRCGHMDQMIKCRQLSTRADDARCKKRCVKKRSCGKHKCNQECCIDIDHICTLPCKLTLSCGKHKCDQQCHRGNCPPCYRSSFEELYCECGAEVIYPPVACGTKRPICKRACSRSHPCDHPPQHTCHSAPTCPPCMIFTTKYCHGKHEQRKTIPCSQESFSCGMACNKPLSCGRHKCIKVCHDGPCQVAGEICKQSCTTPRATCGHKCSAPCHEGECPDTPCKEMVEVQCDCGNRKQTRSCNEVAREFSRIATAQLASSMAEMQRGNYMELSEILAPFKINKTNKTLDCNEDCRLVERNRRLAIAFQTPNRDTTQKLLTKYSDFTRNFAKKDPNLVKTIYDALTNLVKLAKESKQKSRSHSFPVMNREKRQLVHELCEMFGVDSVAYDAEPNRNVVATAYKDRCWFPATSIMEVIKREAGQRRVPVPTNNPWNLKK